MVRTLFRAAGTGQFIICTEGDSIRELVSRWLAWDAATYVASPSSRRKVIGIRKDFSCRLSTFR